MGAGRVILPAVQASARRTIVAWTLYDFANSAFAAVVLSTVYPAYYANVVVGNADGRGDFWWGAAVSTAMVIGALTSLPLGGIADHAGARWNFFVGFSVASIAATALMATVGPGMAWWGWTLAVVGIVTYEAAFVYYNSYLPRIAPPERIGRVSAAGFAVGYAGSLVAFAAAYPFAAAHAYWGCFVAAAVLFAVFSIPAFVILPADARHPMRLATAASRGVGETLATLREILHDPARAQTRRFLTAYLGSAAWARPTDSRGPRFVVGVNLVQWALVTVASFFVVTKGQFWVVAILAGTGLGAVQAASRTFMATLVPPGREAEFFGFYSLVGKTGAIFGPLVFGGVSWLLSGNQRAAIVSVGLFFVVGLALLGRVSAGGPTARAPELGAARS